MGDCILNIYLILKILTIRINLSVVRAIVKNFLMQKGLNSYLAFIEQMNCYKMVKWNLKKLMKQLGLVALVGEEARVVIEEIVEIVGMGEYRMLTVNHNNNNNTINMIDFHTTTTNNNNNSNITPVNLKSIPLSQMRQSMESIFLSKKMPMALSVDVILNLWVKF